MRRLVGIRLFLVLLLGGFRLSYGEELFWLYKFLFEARCWLADYADYTDFVDGVNIFQIGLSLYYRRCRVCRRRRSRCGRSCFGIVSLG